MNSPPDFDPDSLSNRLANLTLIDSFKDSDVPDDLKSRSRRPPVVVVEDVDDEFDLPPFGHEKFYVRKNVLHQRHMSPELKMAREEILPYRRSVSDKFVAQSCKTNKDCQPNCSIFGIGGKSPFSGKGKNKDDAGLCDKKCSPVCCPGKYWDVVGDPNNCKYSGKNLYGASSVLPLDSYDEENYMEYCKGVDMPVDITAKSEEIQSKYAPNGSVMNSSLFNDGFVSPREKNNKVSHVGESCSSLFGICTPADKKESNVHRILPVSPESVEILSSNPRPKKSVRSGNIPANNRRVPNNATKDVNVGTAMDDEFSDGSSSDLITTTSYGFESCWLGGRKGKAIVSNDAAQFAKGTKDKSIFGRSSFRPEEEALDISDISNDTRESSTRMGFEARMAYTSKEPINVLKKNIFSKREDRRGYLSRKSHETRRGVRGCIDPIQNSHEITSSHHEPNLDQVHLTSVPEKETKGCHRHHKQTKYKKKGRNMDSHYGECSDFLIEDPEISCIQPPRQDSNMRLHRNYNTERHGSTFELAIEIDDLYSGGTYFTNSQAENNSDFKNLNTRTNQVESDEILARQLQEQFNQELSGFSGGDEIDATIALSLQEEENEWMASIPRPSQRDASMAHLYTHRPPAPHHSFSHEQPDQISASSRMSHFRRNSNHPAMDMERMMSELRRRLNRAEMDLDMQLSILETFEAALGNRENRASPGGLFSAPRDFSGDDYEMLLALDDNIHRHTGATENQINALPQNVVESNNSEGVCAVCLEVPSAGNAIRQLPCLHKFHKECIDTWLRTKASCPVCKCSII